jgi:ABC-2 type transport system permease protein
MNTLTLLRAKVEGTTFISRGLFKQLKQRDQLWILPLASLGVVAGGGFFMFFLIQNYLGMYQLGLALGRPELVALIGLVASWVLVFVAIFPLALSVMYFSKDSRMLLALPIPQSRIAGVNCMLLYLYSLPIHLLVFLPAALIFLAKTGADVAGVLTTVVVGVTGSLVPLALSLLLVLGITRAVNLSRHRMALEALGMTLLVVLLIGVEVVISRTAMSSLAGSAPSAVAQRVGEAVVGLERWLAPAAWGVRGLQGAAELPWLALFLLVSLGVAAGAFTVVQSGYIRQLMEQAETRGPRRKVRAGRTLPASAELAPRRGVTRALLGRELSILASNSTYLFEAIGEVLIFPIVLGIFSVLIPREYIDQFLPFLLASPALLPIATGVLALMAGLNTVSATSISREGARLGISLSLPLPGRTHVRGKGACYLLLFYPAFLVDSVLVVLLFRLPALDLLVMAPVGLAAECLIFLLTIFSDLRRPLLDWTHPQQAMKQNFNVFVGMGLTLLALLLCGAPAALLLLFTATSAEMALGTAGVMALVLALLLYRPVMAYADRRYRTAFGR